MEMRVAYSKPKSLRFIRWSRNSAAVFHSIKLEVCIGQLKPSVQERIAPKVGLLTLHSSAHQSTVFISNPNVSDETALNIDNLPELQMMCIKTQMKPSYELRSNEFY